MTSEAIQAIMNLVRSEVSTLHTALPGTIKSYNSSTGLCTVTPTGTIKTTTGTLPYPDISGVPVVSPQALATPLSKGDPVLIVICEGSIAGFLAGKEDASTLHHSLSNAVCIPHLRKVAPEAQRLANSKNCTVVQGNLYVTGEIESAGAIKAPNI